MDKKINCFCVIDATRLGKKEIPREIENSRAMNGFARGTGTDGRNLDAGIVLPCRTPQTKPHKFKTDKMRYYRHI